MKIVYDIVNINVIVTQLVVVVIFLGTTTRTLDAFQFGGKIFSSTRWQHQHQNPSSSSLLQPFFGYVDIVTNNNNNKSLLPKNHHHHQRVLVPSTFRLFDSATSGTTQDDDEDEEDDVVDNVTGNQRWLMERFQFPKEKLERSSHSYKKVLTQDNLNLIQRADWLQQYFNYNDEEMNKIVQRSLYILMYTKTNMETTILYCESKFGKKNLKKMVLRRPDLLGNSIETVETRIVYFESKFGEKKAKKMMLQQPGILTLAAENTETKLSFLMSQLSLDESKVLKIFSNAPSIIFISIEKSMMPKISWCQEKFNLSGGEVGKMVVRCPEILTCSIINKQEPNSRWIQQRLNLKDGQVRKIVKRRPRVLTYSTYLMELTLKWLQNEFSLQDSELTNMIISQPTLLGTSIIENLEPTLNFYVESIETDEDVKAFLSRNPRCFCSSLKKRLIPRLKEAKEANIIIDTKCLRKINMLTPDKWESFIGQ